MLRRKLDEANAQLNDNNRQKVSMQENLKKAFMRSVCALNFEAMDILDPNAKDSLSQSQAQQTQINLIEQEMNKQLNLAVQQTPSHNTNQMLGNERLQSSNLVTPLSGHGDLKNFRSVQENATTGARIHVGKL